MKKKFALMLIAVMAVVMVAGCSTNNDDTANQTEPSTAAETTAKATDQQNSEQQQNLIGEDKARNIALKKVKGAKDSDITEFKQDKDDGRQEYEGKIVYDGKEYEFEIDAVSGDVLKWEEEAVNK